MKPEHRIVKRIIPYWRSLSVYPSVRCWLLLYAHYTAEHPQALHGHILGFSALFACILICVNDYFKRQRQSDLIKSQKSLTYFCSYLPLIRRRYRTQKAATVICLLMLVIFIFYIDDSPFLCLIFSSLCATSLYFLIFRVGIFYKQKAIDLIQIIGKTDTVAKTQL